MRWIVYPTLYRANKGMSQAMLIKTPLIEDTLRVLGFLAIVGFLLVDPLGIITGDVLADTAVGAAQGNVDYQNIINILGLIFILAILIEIGLSVLFDWRMFLRYSEGRGWKVPIAFFVSLAIVMTHGIDVPKEVVTVFQGKQTSAGIVGYMISALIIAGGSSSVNGIFERLGWRNPVVQAKKAEQEREKAKGRLWIKIVRPTGGTSDGQPVTVSIDGLATGVLAPNQDTFGGSDGHAVKQGERTIKVTWSDQSGSLKEAEEKAVVVVGQPVSKTLTLT